MAHCGAAVAPGGMVAPNGCGGGDTAATRRRHGGTSVGCGASEGRVGGRMRFTWSASDSTIEYYGGEEKRKPAWHCRRRRHAAAAAPQPRPLGANGGATTGCHWVPTAPPGGMRRGAATGNFDGRRVPKLFIATATPLVLLVLLKTVAHRGLAVALLSGRISSVAHCENLK